MTITATQHLRRMRGGSQSHLLQGSDDHFYVTKFRNNPQHLRVLANELLASRIGHALRLPMPRVEVINVPESLISSTDEMKIEFGVNSIPCSPGTDLGSRYVCPLQDTVFDCLPVSTFKKLSNAGDFARVLVLDKWLGNADGRQAIFTKPANERLFRATFIDQGYCFNAGEWDFPDHPLKGVWFRNELYSNVTGWDAFDPSLHSGGGDGLIRHLADRSDDAS